MLRYWLNRKIDVTGTSGTGKVAEVVLFSNGLVVVAWLGEHPTVEVHPSIQSVIDLHGHQGRTTLEIMC